jgi:ankyrin repeat protein
MGEAYWLTNCSKETTVKTVSSLLDKEPRWLRPKNREEMNQRIVGLSLIKRERKARREAALVKKAENTQFSDAILSAEFTETPLQYLLEYAARNAVPLTGDVNPLQAPDPALELSPSFGKKFVLLSSSLEDMSELGATTRTAFENNTRITAIDNMTTSTYFSTASLKKRLSQYSYQYIKDIARLRKMHSMPESSGASTTIASSMSITVTDGSTTGTRMSTIRLSSSTVAPAHSKSRSLILPNSFLHLDRYIKRQGICIAGLPAHDSKNCWCLEDLHANGQLWVHRNGLVNFAGSEIPQSLDHLDLKFRDAFGNTVLHMLAARGAELSLMVKVLEQRVDGNAKNTAGQNFLHVLPRPLLRVLVENWSCLIWLLQNLNKFNVRYCDCDLFGRSFLHLLSYQARNVNPNSLQVLESLNIPVLLPLLQPSRDAFGWVVMNGLMVQSGSHSRKLFYWERGSREVFLGLNSEPLPIISEEKNTVPSMYPNTGSTSNGDCLFKHARLLETARLAIDTPRIEDSEGRNGLQCLAEASLTLSIAGKLGPNKRKRGQAELDPLSTSLKFRYELVQRMMHLGVDVNHYDKEGNTVLMAFVTHLEDGEDDKTLSRLLRNLIEYGANVHWRNRRGETALHLAVRLGRKVATKVLLKTGANVHARTPEGKGVLALGERYYLRARDQPKLYASILACMALVMGYSAVAAPTRVQEWSTKCGGLGRCDMGKDEEER